MIFIIHHYCYVAVQFISYDHCHPPSRFQRHLTDKLILFPKNINPWATSLHISHKINFKIQVFLDLIEFRVLLSDGANVPFLAFKELNLVISTALYSKAMTLIRCHIEKQSRAGMAAEQSSSGAQASPLYCWECRRQVAANWGGIFWHIADFSVKQSEFELARAQLFSHET